MVLLIKNMVCYRCKLAVEALLKRIGLTPLQIELGEVSLAETAISTEQRRQLTDELTKIGFELLDDKRSRLIEQIKALLINEIHYAEKPTNEKYSHLISRRLQHDYSYLSNLFSEVEGITIEQYILNQKIEKVKELLIYGDHTLADIAFQLGYSSTAHLSSQFKKLTGLTPTQFKQLGVRNRRSLDSIS
jgi:AraC-like DNA-binding protein